MEHLNVVGQTNFRGQHRPFGIYEDDRRRHVYAIGKTGVGKTTLLENMLIQDIENGKGVALVDPHGDIAERVLDAIPPNRVNDVVYFDPADTEYPVAFNVLEAIDPEYKYLVASGLVSSLKKIWADSWGPRLEYILRNTILALLDYPSSTLLGIMRMLSDKNYRKKVVDTINDPVVKSFWVNEFANYNERFRSEAVSPIQNKIGQFLSSVVVRNLVAQPKSTIDMQDIMNSGKILIINVSKGKIGEDNSALLGAMLITKIQLAAMDRAKIPEAERKDFYLYVDEFQNFATESFATILSEARKYRLNLIIAHQYINQMEEEVRDAVFGNVGTIMAFRVGAYDAEYLSKEFAPQFTEEDLVNLDKFNACVRLMINGVTSKPFSMQTIPPSVVNYGTREKVISVSRERYARKRSVVEERVARWSGITSGEETADSRPGKDTRIHKVAPEKKEKQEPNIDEKELVDVALPSTNKEEITDLSSLLSGHRDEKPQEKHEKKSYEITCADCGKLADVPFKPDPEKEAYCKACFERHKQEKRAAEIPLQKKVPERDLHANSTDTLNVNRPKPPTF